MEELEGKIKPMWKCFRFRLFFPVGLATFTNRITLLNGRHISTRLQLSTPEPLAFPILKQLWNRGTEKEKISFLSSVSQFELISFDTVFCISHLYS